VIQQGRGRPRPQSLRGRRRPQRVERVPLGDLRPDPVALLARTAYLELTLFEAASTIAARASDLADRETVTRVASAILAQHTALVDLLAEQGQVAAEAMQPYVAEVDRYWRRFGETGWHESVLTLHLATGLLNDFFAQLGGGLPRPLADRYCAVLTADIGQEALVGVLSAAVAADRRMTSRLALWGRRIVGDTLLAARAALDAVRDPDGRPTETEERRIEPVLNDLIAAHTRRMDRLGLTA
jgi:tRNA-(MS[2]IO[6]A)-hydroxylase MiaE-like protein